MSVTLHLTEVSCLLFSFELVWHMDLSHSAEQFLLLWKTAQKKAEISVKFMILLKMILS